MMNYQIQHIINLQVILEQKVKMKQELVIEDYPVNLKNILLELGITMDGVY